MDVNLLRSLPKDVLILMIEKNFELEDLLTCENALKLIKSSVERINREKNKLLKNMKKTLKLKDLFISSDINKELTIKNDKYNLKLNFHLDSIDVAFLWDSNIMRGFHFENFKEMFNKIDQLLLYSCDDMNEIKIFIENYFKNYKSYQLLVNKIYINNNQITLHY